MTGQATNGPAIAAPAMRRMVGGGMAQLVVRAAGIALALAVVPVVTRYLGAARYGDLTLILAIVSFLVMAADFGLPLLASRDLPGLDGEDRDRWMAGFWSARLTLAAAAVAVGGGIALFVPLSGPVRLGLVVALAGVPAALVSNAVAGMLNADFRPARAAAAELSARIAYTAGIVLVVVVFGGGLPGVVFAVTVSQLAALAVVLAVARRSRLFPAPGADRVRRRAMMAAAAPLALLPLLGLVYSRSDVIVLAARTTSTEVGVYGLIWRVLEILLSLAAIATSLLVPVFAADPSRDGQRRAYRRSLEVLGLGIVPAAVAVALLATPILTVLGGDGFAAPTPTATGSVVPGHALALVMGAFALMTLGFVNGAVLVARRAHAILFLHFGLAIAANLALTLALVGRWSYAGAAAATLVAEGFAAAFSTWMVARVLGPLDLMRSMAWPVAGGAVAAAAVLAAAPLGAAGQMAAVAVAVPVFAALSPPGRRLLAHLSRPRHAVEEAA